MRKLAVAAEERDIAQREENEAEAAAARMAAAVEDEKLREADRLLEVTAILLRNQQEAADVAAAEAATRASAAEKERQDALVAILQVWCEVVLLAIFTTIYLVPSLGAVLLCRTRRCHRCARRPRTGWLPRVAPRRAMRR